MRIILASGSPRRKLLMELAGIPCEIIVSNADETVSGEPEEQVKELALRKAKTVFQAENGNGNICVVGADTIVYINGKVLGKPENHDEAFEMLKTLSGQKHTVYTGVAIITTAHGETVFADKTDVYFHNLSDDFINDYIATGEPFDKAGAYGVQEKGAVLVRRVEGDFYTVVGLPISLVYNNLKTLGCNL